MARAEGLGVRWLGCGIRYSVRWIRGLSWSPLPQRGRFAIACAVVVGVRFLNQSYDDAYITYRYAHNVALGNGMVYNVGERFFGDTAPLYTLILGWLGRLTDPALIPRISGVISALSLLLTGVGVVQLGRPRDCIGLGVLASLLYILNPELHRCFGTEMLAQIAVGVWTFVALDRRRYGLSVGLGCLVALIRPDGLAILPVLIAVIAYRERKLPLLPIGLVVAILSPFAFWAHSFYGTFLPQTLHAKVLQGLGKSYLASVAGHVQDVALSSPAPVAVFALIVFAAVGLAFLPRYRFFAPMLAWVTLKELGYQAIGSSFYNWYAFPAYLGIALLAATGMWGLAAVAAKRSPISWVGPVVAGGFAAWLGWAMDTRMLGREDVRKDRYQAIGRWLKANTPPNASVACLEIGWLGYECERPIVDLWGLVSPGVADHQASADSLYAYRVYHPDLVLIDSQILTSYSDGLLKTYYFTHQYTPRVELDYAPWKPVTVYVREGSVALTMRPGKFKIR